MKIESTSFIAWTAIGLFIISEAVHKVFVFSGLLVMPAHGFALISRIVIYAWFSWQLAKRGFSVSRFIVAIIFMSMFEFLVLGMLSIIAFGILHGTKFILPAFQGVIISYPVVLAAVLLQCLLVLGIFRWWSSSRKAEVRR